MNINLGSNYPVDEDGEPETFIDQIAEHHDIMNHSGWSLVGLQAVMLLAEPDPDYPGSFQVWSKTEQGSWVYITPDGVALEAEAPVGVGHD